MRRDTRTMVFFAKGTPMTIELGQGRSTQKVLPAMLQNKHELLKLVEIVSAGFKKGRTSVTASKEYSNPSSY